MTSTVPLRILEEPRIYEDALFFVVKDIEPVVEGHFLLISKTYLQCLADAPRGSVSEFLAAAPVDLGISPAWIFERGRASFCTSVGAPFAHAHLIPAVFGSRVRFQAAGNQYSDLERALDAVRQLAGEYLLWGQAVGTARVAVDIEHQQKRLIRSAFVEVRS
ncbi:MAG TPA: HIT domain-containing protein [Thermoanaerobaculia bacterium]|nr:HIT domain-containing protein [Thermoanaerobaculia bacterium]